MGTRSTASILSSLREGSQSNHWNAIVAYDKTCANALLAQEYISRFSADSYLKAITTKIPATQDESEYVVDFILDRPRLSFERASVNWSQAKLVLKVIGGTHLTARTPMGQPEQLVRVASYDTLNGPELRMGITLSVLLGSVDIKGRIAFDLSRGTDITLTYSNDPEKRRLGGEFFRAYFEKLPEKDKVFVLNEIGSSEGQYLNPRNVQIRTQAASAGSAGDNVDDGSGAILMFITMEGEDYGQFPDSDDDLTYLIPDDGATPYTTAILLDNRFFMNKFVEEGFQLLTQSSEPCEIDTSWSDSGFVASMSLKKGERTGQSSSSALAHFPSVRLAGLKTPMAGQDANGQPLGNTGFTLTFVDDAVIMEWKGEQEQSISLTTAQGNTYSHPLPSFWLWRKRYVFSVNADSNEMKWVPAPDSDQAYYKVTPGAYASIKEVADHFAEISRYVEDLLYTQLQGCAEDFVSPLENIDVFRLNSILFRDHHVMHSVDAHLPGDVIIFGNINTDVTAFSVSPLEPLAGAGEKLQFSTEPATGGVSWRVQNVPGNSGSPGVIDASTGAYTAPAANEVEGFFTRVKITATRGEYSSSALVTVMARDITFNPLVTVCGLGESCEMSAKARDNRPLEWSIVGPETGSKILPSTLEEGDHTYFAPPKPEQGAPPSASLFSLDEVQVQVTGSEASIKYSSYVLLLNRPVLAFITIKADAGLPEGQLQLQAEMGEGPVDLDCRWTVLKGSGQVDSSTGVFTHDPEGQHRFALITVEIPPPATGWPSTGAFIILPVPYVEWQKIKAIDES